MNYEVFESIHHALARAQETYSYYTLPFCAPQPALEPAVCLTPLRHVRARVRRVAQRKWGGLSEIFEGTESLNSNILIRFKRATRARRRL